MGHALSVEVAFRFAGEFLVCEGNEKKKKKKISASFIHSIADNSIACASLQQHRMQTHVITHLSVMRYAIRDKQLSEVVSVRHRRVGVRMIEQGDQRLQNLKKVIFKIFLPPKWIRSEKGRGLYFNAKSL
jgi:hypothetical protein